jgi:hypothetical protein
MNRRQTPETNSPAARMSDWSRQLAIRTGLCYNHAMKESLEIADHNERIPVSEPTLSRTAVAILEGSDTNG